MKLSLISRRGIGSAGAIALGVIAGMVACSDDGASDPSLPQIDGGPVTPERDANGQPEDASVDANADADAEAGPPRVCSDDDFCHTTLPPKEILRAVWADGQGTAWAVGDSGDVLRYDGATWTKHAMLDGALRSVWGSGPNDVWIGGEEGLFHGTGASAASLVFTNVNAPGDVRAPITSIWGRSATDVWAAGGVQTSPNIGRVLHLTSDGADAGADPDAGADAGSSSGWSLVPAFTPPVDTTRIWGTPDGSVWVAGLRLDPITRKVGVAVLRRLPGASSTFADVPIPGDPKGAPFNAGGVNKIWDASVAADGTIFILGRTDTSLAAYVCGTTTDGGQTVTWTFVPTGSVTEPTRNSIWGAAASDVWMAGDYGRLGHWNGSAWTQAKTTISKYPEIAPLYAVWGRAGGELWVVGDGIAMHRAAGKN
ncbi:MAG: hypothetical protein QOI41_1895 [Myxococcales bacterium]|nr:hypothetical protein [Myxococcales bacterium]